MPTRLHFMDGGELTLPGDVEQVEGLLRGSGPLVPVEVPRGADKRVILVNRDAVAYYVEELSEGDRTPSATVP